MRQLFIVDPGMMEAGGHHAALISTLISYDEISLERVSLVTHKNLDPTLSSQAEQRNISIIRHFESNFYEHYGTESSVKSLNVQKYIRTLAQEYLLCFELMLAGYGSDSQLTFFYPCLNWEHATALNLALTLMAKRQDMPIEHMRHKVCCMFTPNNFDGNVDRLKYQQSFGPLASNHGVELFASDLETREYYEKLNIPIVDIHPCYLLPWPQLSAINDSEKINSRILLYFGDAKENKGFNKVPALAKKLLQESDSELIVQYTLAWSYPELEKSIAELDTLSAKYNQLKIFKEFWNTDKLVNELLKVDSIYCTYDTEVYKNKSSGLVWLATFFKIPVIMNGKCWLTREFDRLGHKYLISNGNEILEMNKATSVKDKSYLRSIYSNLVKWLVD